MKVRWVLEDAERLGGVESVVRSLDAGLRERGLDSRIASWLPGVSESHEHGTTAWFTSKVRAARSRELAARQAAGSLRRELDSDPTLVVVLDPGSLSVARHLRGAPRWGLHAHWSPDLLLTPWRHLSGEGVPRVLGPLVSARARAAGRRNARLLRSASFVVTLTSSHTRALRSLAASLHEIPNPIDCRPVTRRAVPEAGSVVTIGYVGRLSREKRPDLLIDAFARIGTSSGPTRLIVAGSGLDESATRQRVRRLGLEGVEFLGWVERPRAVLDRIDVLVLPSRTEAVPLVLVEALAAGCRVVATDAGSGVREVLDNGRLGRIVGLDGVEQLTAAIEDAVTDVRIGTPVDLNGIDAVILRHEPSSVLDMWTDLISEQSGKDASRG